MLLVQCLDVLQLHTASLSLQVLQEMCKQGYRDALHFLKKNGKLLIVLHSLAKVNLVSAVLFSVSNKSIKKDSLSCIPVMTVYHPV